MIPLSVPNICGNEQKYVSQALKDGWVSTVGGFVTQFEDDICGYVKSNFAVACQSGTAGLHLALKYAEVCSDELVIVPALTFVSPVNTVKYVGASPVFIDCDDTLCMDPVKLRHFCNVDCRFENNCLTHIKTGKHVRAIIIVHVFGNICNMEKIVEIATDYNLFLIEDATEALGTYYLSGQYVGQYAGTIADIGVYSFNGNKIITTGGGGMVVCKEKAAADKIRYWSTQAKDDALNFVHHEVGYNYRMTNIQAAIGVAQMEQLERFISIKKKNYDYYKSLLENNYSVSLLPFCNNIRSNYWFYSICLTQPNLIQNKDNIIAQLNQLGVQVRPVWALINHQKPYLNDLAPDTSCAESYQKSIINIPCSSSLTADEVENVVNIITKVIAPPPPREWLTLNSFSFLLSLRKSAP